MIEVGCVEVVGRCFSLVGFEVYLFVCLWLCSWVRLNARYPRPPNLRSPLRGL